MLKFLTVFSFIICSSFNSLASETTGVVTTIQPINSLVSSVIGNTGKTITLIPAEVSPHEHKLKPSDTKKLQNANIIFFVSDHLESSIAKVFDKLPKNIKIINLMEESGIKHLAIRDNEAWERHDHHHGHGDHDDHDKHAKNMMITTTTNMQKNMMITTMTNMQKNTMIMTTTNMQKNTMITTTTKKKMTFTSG